MTHLPSHIIRLAVLSAFMALACLSGRAADAVDTRILYINSYHRGYSWSDGIEQGLRDTLLASGKPIEISIEYLDSRRFAYGAQIGPLAQSMAIKYANYRPHLVVVSDNAAFDFAIQYRKSLFPDVPIVFTGYNNFRPEVLRGIHNVTGVNEEIAIEDTVAMAVKVHPKTRTLAFVISTGEASSKRISEVAEQSVFPKLRQNFDLVVLKDASLDEIRQRLAGLPHDTLLFLSGQVRDQGIGRALTPAENGSLITAVSPFPAYTFWDFHIGRGVIGGHIITGPEQGRAAAKLALRVLDGTPADNIPVIMTTPASDIFDYAVMEHFGVSPSALPPKATLINRPVTLWDAYRYQIIGVGILLTLESVLIALLLHIAMGRRKALAALAAERQLLEQRVEQRTAELQDVNAQLAVLNNQDGLTRIANRRHFDETLSTELLRLRRSQSPLSLIMLDIDYFKNYNDTQGHVAGDECLRRVGQLIAGIVGRTSDLAARYGGEEFAVILPETDAQGAVLLAEQIRSEIEKLAIAHTASSAADHVTASLGVVTVVPEAVSSAQDVIRMADVQLYRAKTNGRNRVCSDARPATLPA